MYRTAIILVTIGAITFASGIFSSAAVMTAYAQPSITIQSIRCALITANQMGVGVAFVVSGVSHDSFTLKYPVAIFAPNGNLVPQAGADDIIVTIPSGAPDPATTDIGTNFPITPSTPAPGTYKLIAIPDGQPVCTTFNAPDCSASFASPSTAIASAVDGNGNTIQNGGTTSSNS
ncbi:MAG: hypothetical protein WCF23_06275 [Candidatus Nitrosopolaris sp.]